MTDTNEQTILLNLIAPITHINSDTENYFSLDYYIKTINRMDPYDSIVLHVPSRYHGSNEVVQLLLTNNALRSIKDISYPSTSYDRSRIDEINKLLQNKSNLFCSHEEVQDYEYIEWSLIGNNLIKKRQEFRQQIDLYKTYDNQHHLITKLLIEIIEYYLNEYLVQQEHFSQDETKKLKFYFTKAIEEQSYLKYFIKAYTLTNNFYRVLNKHLALYILDYFDTSSYTSSPTKYRLINCLVHIVTLLINHPDIHKYTYIGITYRGLLMTENDLKHYGIGNHILNRSFVSTSKNRSIAQMFADNSQQPSAQISVLFKYIIKQKQTAIDIEHISTIQDEKEVLILPFSVFQIKDRIENNLQMSPPVLVEIELEECEYDEQINDKNRKSKPPVNLRYRTKKRKNVSGSTSSYGSIGLFVICSLILAVIFYLREKIKLNNASQNQEEKISKISCPPMINRSVWNASKPKLNTTLSTPVPYVGIHHTTGEQCSNLSTCILNVQGWQRMHMINKNWDDIGYNFLVGSNGYVFEGRGWNYTGAHCKGYNSKSIGIGVIGDYTSIRPKPSVLMAVRSLINCGISIGFIQKNYTLLGHWGFGIVEYYMVTLNKTHHRTQYCETGTTTIAPK